MTSIPTLAIQPATNFTSTIWASAGGRGKERPGTAGFLVSELRFEVPLRHHHPGSPRLRLVGRMVYGESDNSVPAPLRDWAAQLQTDDAGSDQPVPLRDRPILLYLCGGPGADNPWHRVPDMNRFLLRQGYQLLYIDYRGCGESDPVSQATVRGEKGLRTDREVADYIKLFGQDNIVRDLEAVRLCLDERLKAAGRSPQAELKWSILGQSYGGYISLTYLSFHPDGLKEVFITAGLPPCGMPIDDYFRVKYSKLVKQTREFYARYPDAERVVRDILGLISEIGAENIRMTGRGYLTGQKLLTLGRQFGSRRGFEEVYVLLTRIRTELLTSQKLDAKTIRAFERTLHIDERPLYALLLEQTWCSSGATQWSAERVWRELPGFEYLKMDENGRYREPSTLPENQPIYLTSHVYGRFMFDTHEELFDFKGAAELLAAHEWESNYDEARLRQNKVPVYAVSFVSDMHLDIEVARQTAAKVGNMRLIVDDVNWHQDLRHMPAEILGRLFKLRDEAGRN
ncbi:alpha/beta-hydrolase [Thozetella sp. PMI_491]|nr:alpha/beta-hydrolase [Thozetella sp. PMI_491]